MLAKGPTVLIVDDDQRDLEDLEKTLSSIRLHTVTTRDPHEVLQKVSSEHPDLVILDALLPGMSGFDLCQQIKSKSETKKTRVVILTGVYLKDRYRREAVNQFKADGFVTKPYREKDLQRLVLRLLAKKLKTTPRELQQRLSVSKEVLPRSEVDEKPGWFGRLFRRSTLTPEASPGLGLLGRARDQEAPAAGAFDREAQPAVEEPVVEGHEQQPAEVEPAEQRFQGPSPDATIGLKGKLVPEPPKPVGVEEAPATENAGVREAEAPEEEAGTDSRGASETPTAAQRDVEVPELPPTESRAAQESTADEEEGAGGRLMGADVDAGPADQPSKLKAAMAVFGSLEGEEETKVAAEATSRASGTSGPPASQPEEGFEATEPKPRPTEGVLQEEAASDACVAEPALTAEGLPIYEESRFLHELKREALRCSRVDRSLTLILIRIADLGQIVELFGRQFRAKVFRHVAIQALECLREVDMVGLLETDELVALTAFASNRYGGERIVKRLQAALGRHPFQVGEGIPSFIPKLRFGMAVYPGETASYEELLERAHREVELAGSAS